MQAEELEADQEGLDEEEAAPKGAGEQKSDEISREAVGEPEDSSSDTRNVIMITEQSSMRRQLAFAIAKLLKNEDITISAYASNISKAIKMAEIVKQRVNQLH